MSAVVIHDPRFWWLLTFAFIVAITAEWLIKGRTWFSPFNYEGLKDPAKFYLTVFGFLLIYGGMALYWVAQLNSVLAGGR